MRLSTLTLSVFLVLASLFCRAQQLNTDYIKYIDQYKQIAIDQMHQYKIPASITLAQALLESGAGKSELARKSNNHFGIKVSAGWTGPFVTYDDDRKGEKFRKYSNVSQSYDDHSQFLLKNRYKPLFSLDPLDYKAWARGLKACGYATNPSYANLLINIIEKYELAQYDEDRFGIKRRRQTPQLVEKVKVAKRAITQVNGKDCVKAKSGDTWESIAKEMKVSKKKLMKYNEVDETIAVVPGQNVFLQKKAKKAAKQYKGYWHKIAKGESMYSISQQYGITLASLYKLNFKDDSYIPVAGDILRVR